MVDNRPAGPGRASALGLTMAAALLACGTAHAQTVMPDPRPNHSEAVAAEPPPGAFRAVKGPNAWVLERVEPSANARAAEPASTEPSPAARPGRFRAEPAPGGAWVLVDGDAADEADASGPPAHARASARAGAGGALVLEMPTSEARPETRAPNGLRIVEIRSAEEAARAMAQPEPFVLYRVVK